jgi:hypothetical protein
MLVDTFRHRADLWSRWQARDPKGEWREKWWFGTRARALRRRMAYFMLVMGKAGICRGASSHRNNASWHDVTDLGRPLSGSRRSGR